MPVDWAKLGTLNTVCILTMISNGKSTTDYPAGSVQGHVTSLNFWHK